MNTTHNFEKQNVLSDSNKLYLYNLYYEDFKQFNYLK